MQGIYRSVIEPKQMNATIHGNPAHGSCRPIPQISEVFTIQSPSGRPVPKTVAFAMVVEWPARVARRSLAEESSKVTVVLMKAS